MRDKQLSGALVSVIVPVYKAEQTLEKCALSILGQTHRMLELILVDDGSPDGSGTLCDAIAAEDARVKVIHCQNGGVSAARNRGLEAATGDYIAFVDSDDHIETLFLADALAATRAQDTDLYISGLVMETNQEGVVVRLEELSGPTRVYTVQTLLEAFNVDYPFFFICSACGKLYRADVIKVNALRFDTRLDIGEDTVFLCDYLANAQRVYFSETVHYHYYRGNAESLFSRYNPHMFDSNVIIYDRMRRLMEDKSCSRPDMARFDALYARILVGCIYHEFIFCRASTKASRKATIRKVVDNPYVRRCSLRDYHHPKDLTVHILLKLRQVRLLNRLFAAHYCRGKRA